MKKMAKNFSPSANLKQFHGLPLAGLLVFQAWLGALSLLTHVGASAQEERATPGAAAGSEMPPVDESAGAFESGPPMTPPTSTAGNGGTKTPAKPDGLPADVKAKLGDYVELDESIRNEMYGQIDFNNKDLKDIVMAISKMAGKNFILDAKINNRKITIVSPVPVTKQEVYNAFLSALYMNDFTIVSMGKFLKIIEAKNAIQSNIRVFMGDNVPPSEEVVTVLYPLKYLNADEIQRFLTDLVPRNGRISSYPNTNTLVMTDTGLNLRRIVGILKSIDVPGHEDQLESIQIRYASAKGIAALIDDILEAQSGGRRTGSAARNQPQKTRGGGTITKIVPDERTNSLVILANGKGVQELRNLVFKLDSPDAAGGGNIHIYFCKNAVAEELAGTINNLVSGQKQGQGNLPGGVTLPPPPAAGGNNRSSSSGGDGVKFEGNLKVTFDKPSNSLVVVASGSDFAALKMVLKKLDVPRRQVYVEGTIMELNAGDTKTFEAGVLAPPVGFSTKTGTDLASIIANPGSLTGLVSIFGSGNTVKINLPNGKTAKISTLAGFINAVQTSKQGNILHQPQILTSDNQEAEINVKQGIAVQTGQTSVSGGTSSSTTSTSREDIVIGLKITPQIGKENDLVKMKVEQQMDDFQGSSAGVKGQIDRTVRKATTTVVVRDGDTVVIGGLQKNVTDAETSKFPLIGDLPIIGWLFKGGTNKFTKSNLVLFLTPHIINEYKDLIKLTESKIESRAKLGRTQFDPADQYKEEVEALKKETSTNLAKPAPRGWGFSPKDSGEDIGPEKEEQDSAEATTMPDSASVETGGSGYMQALSDDESAQKKKAASGSSTGNAAASAPPPAASSSTPDPLLTIEDNASAGSAGAEGEAGANAR